jgi:ribosome biogenesis protein NSA2
MPQNDYIDLHKKRFGERLDTEERQRKKEAREPHELSKKAQSLKGLKAKLFNKQRFKEKIRMKKLIRAHEEKKTEVKNDTVKENALPAYLLDRDEVHSSKILSNMVKEKRKEKAGKFTVPI